PCICICLATPSAPLVRNTDMISAKSVNGMSSITSATTASSQLSSKPAELIAACNTFLPASLNNTVLPAYSYNAVLDQDSRRNKAFKAGKTTTCGTKLGEDIINNQLV